MAMATFILGASRETAPKEDLICKSEYPHALGWVIFALNPATNVYFLQKLERLDQSIMIGSKKYSHICRTQL